MKIEAFAKVNFTLEVLGKRVDGYHALRSVVVPVTLADSLDIETTDDGLIASDTGYADDLCVKAARTLRAAKPGRAGACIRVVKRIPAGGGLGGGSADAAAVLRALNALWGCGLSMMELADLGAAVGSDVPALVLAQTLRAPVLMEGRGETVTPLFPNSPLSTLHSPLSTLNSQLSLVLVNPGVFSSTPEVFRHTKAPVHEGDAILARMRDALAAGNRSAAAEALQNDLEPAACALHPEIAAAKDALRESGAEGVVMTGSGSTVLGLVAGATEGERIAAVLNNEGLKAWSVSTLTR